MQRLAHVGGQHTGKGLANCSGLEACVKGRLPVAAPPSRAPPHLCALAAARSPPLLCPLPQVGPRHQLPARRPQVVCHGEAGAVHHCVLGRWKVGHGAGHCGGGGGGLSTDAIAVAPGGMPNPLLFAASGTDATTLLVGRRTNVGLPSYLL